MSSIAFFFDVDGVLLRSHELQAEAIRDALQEQVELSKLELYVPSVETVLRILIGGTEATSIKSILDLLPELSEHMPEIVARAWNRYFQLLTDPTKSPAIKSSVALLRTLHEIGHSVCLVTNSKKNEVLQYCKLLGLEFISQMPSMIVSIEDVKEAKPAPDLYLRAASNLDIEPAECVVFEDSVSGVQAAQRAGMRIVGLNTYMSDEDLKTAGANEVVANLLHSSIVIDNVSTPPFKPRNDSSTVLEALTIQDLSMDRIDLIVSETYNVYKVLFGGRTKASWKTKIYDTRDICTRIGLLRSSSGQLIGYGTIKIQEITFDGEKRLIALSSVGSLGGVEQKALLLQYFQQDYRRLSLSFPFFRMDFFDNFLSFNGYNLAARVFKQVIPNPDQDQPSEADMKYMLRVADHIGYKKAPVSDSLAYLSASHILQQSPATRSNDKFYQYFISRAGSISGHGLFGMASVCLANFQPVTDLTPLAKL